MQATVDQKGRLKLPAKVQEYIISLGDKAVFITTLDQVTAKVYGRTTWEENKLVLANFTDDPEAADDVLLVANHFGADDEMDDQGRVLIPHRLRGLLSLEGATVQLECAPGVISVYAPRDYDARLSRAVDNLGAKVNAVRRKGFK